MSESENRWWWVNEPERIVAMLINGRIIGPFKYYELADWQRDAIEKDVPAWRLTAGID